MSIYSLNLHAISTQQLEELACMIQEQLDARRGWVEEHEEARRAADIEGGCDEDFTADHRRPA